MPFSAPSAVRAAAFPLLWLSAAFAADAPPPTPESPSSAAVNPAPAAPRHTNRLAKEKSPYLLQHAHNPVDWYPWGPEAFARAKAENKPILLSIGYSTCHWCHVMERESFENEEIGAFLNEHFIAIKLDREERPDVDHLYMTAMQALGLGGGWPLNVFLTPDLKPFYGGTYFPPENRGGRAGFLQVLRRVAELWKEDHAKISQDANRIAEQLREHMAAEGKSTEAGPADPECIVEAARYFADAFDETHGGYGGAPKFPQPKVPSLLLLTGAHLGNQPLIDSVLFTCRRMAEGGMYDQLGGGFARYSVDAKWLVPHFEKMLYDNAQLIDLYLDAGLVSGDPRYHAVARDVIRYVLRDMTHADGGFYSAEDADSEGHEGKFYTFTKKEIEELLTPEEAALAVSWFGVTEEGNFIDHSHPDPLKNQNVLFLATPDRKLTADEEKLLCSAKDKLFAAQRKRVRPHLDDKILTSWNGLTLGALARAGIILDEPAWIEAARRNLAFVREKLWKPETKTLFHRWRDGERDAAQLLVAYAFYLNGAIDYYQATLDTEALEFCAALADGMIEKFYDPENGGFFSSAGGGDLLFKVKDGHDGAEPGGNSTAVYALLKLAAITENTRYREAAEKTLRFFSGRLQELPQALPWMLHAVAFASDEPFRAVIAGDVKTPEGRALLRAAHAVYQPNRVILGTTGPVEPFARALKTETGAPAAFVCTGASCLPPATDPEQVRKNLAPAFLKEKR